jgi:hypothetical protein
LSNQLLSGEKQSQIHNSLHLGEKEGLLQQSAQHFAVHHSTLTLINSDEAQLHVEEAAANSPREWSS